MGRARNEHGLYPLLVAVLSGFQVFKPWAALLNPMKMEKKVFETTDGILAELPIPKSCPVSVTIDERGYVLLRVGPRDWIWKDDGSFLGAGTLLESSGQINCPEANE